MVEFTDDQLGKRVVAQRGAEVGRVSDVRDGTLFVEVEAEAETADEGALDQLGWTGTVEQDVHRLPDEHVSDVSEQTIRLRV